MKNNAQRKVFSTLIVGTVGVLGIGFQNCNNVQLANKKANSTTASGRSPISTQPSPSAPTATS